MFRLHLTAASVAALACLSPACSKVGSLGESCTHSGECGASLLCVNARCVYGSSGYAAGTNVCVLHQCREDTDCPGTLTCGDGRCGCENDAQCGTGRFCEAGGCVSCRGDSDCSGGEVCDAGRCQDPCEDTLDCPDFNTCTGGRCAYTGCQDDLSCALSAGDVRARCDLDSGACYTQCTYDSDCGSLVGGWQGQVCDGGRCASVGCTDDDDCQLLFPTGAHGECVESTGGAEATRTPAQACEVAEEAYNAAGAACAAGAGQPWYDLSLDCDVYDGFDCPALVGYFDCLAITSCDPATGSLEVGDCSVTGC